MKVLIKALMKGLLNCCQVVLCLALLAGCGSQGSGAGNADDTDPPDTCLDCDTEPDPPDCIGLSENLLSVHDGDFSAWGRHDSGNNIEFFQQNHGVTFRIGQEYNGRLFIGKSIRLQQGRAYVIRVRVLSQTVSPAEVNMALTGIDSDKITGVSELTVAGPGQYALAFHYLGQTRDSILRLGLGVSAIEPVGQPQGALLSLDRLMVQVVAPERLAPFGPYTAPGARWAFATNLDVSYQPATGRYQLTGNSRYCSDTHRKVWAIVGDSFANETDEYPVLLQQALPEMAFYVDAQGGRPLAQMGNPVAGLLGSGRNEMLVKPGGLILQGGVNDLIGGATLEALQQSVQTLDESAQGAGASLIYTSIPPFREHVSWSPQREQLRLAYNHWLRGYVAQSAERALCDLALPVTQGGLASTSDPEVPAPGLAEDGLHPTPAGSRMIRDCFMSRIESISTASYQSL